MITCEPSDTTLGMGGENHITRSQDEPNQEHGNSCFICRLKMVNLKELVLLSKSMVTTNYNAILSNSAFISSAYKR